MVLRTRVDGSRVVVDVEDEGPGLEQDDLVNAFDRGALHAKYRDVRGVGTGLGLSIARRLAERMHAEIGVRSSPSTVIRDRNPALPSAEASLPISFSLVSNWR